MKKLILMRHGKSNWSDPGFGDHERPLNARGRVSAPAMAGWLAANGHAPDTILCSPSKRTRQTVELMRQATPDLPEPVVEGALYHGSPGGIRQLLRRLPGECRTVLVIAHQPGLGELARLLASGAEPPRCSRAFSHFPTAAVAILEADIDEWSGLAWHGADFVDFRTPRELSEGQGRET